MKNKTSFADFLGACLVQLINFLFIFTPVLLTVIIYLIFKNWSLSLIEIPLFKIIDLVILFLFGIIGFILNKEENLIILKRKNINKSFVGFLFSSIGIFYLMLFILFKFKILFLLVLIQLFYCISIYLPILFLLTKNNK